MELRYYQQRAIDALYKFLAERATNPCIVLPTGSGKTPVIANICKDAVIRWDGRVLILAHVKELLEQSADKLRLICPTVRFGVYSAGLKKRETDAAVIIAGVQSVYDKAEQLGRFDLVLVDEAHLIPPSGDGMYRQLIRNLTDINPDIRVIGLTATPYRMGTGLICTEDGILNEVCYEVGVKELINAGYICPLVGKAAVNEIDTRSLSIVRGEYEEAGAEAAFSGVVQSACREIIEKTTDRKSVLVFTQTVQHGRNVAACLRAELLGRTSNALAELRPAEAWFELGEDPLAKFETQVIADWLDEQNHPTHFLREFFRSGQAQVGEIYGDTPTEERDRLTREFRAGRLKYLVNVNVLTTGFDAPNVDCVAILRATASPGLYYQIVGRGFRLSEGKVNCLILDFGENIKRHGPVDMVQKKAANQKKKSNDGEPLGKTCPECREVVASRLQVCVCGYQFEVSSSGPNHNSSADNEDPVSGPAKVEEFDVLAVKYRVHRKKGGDETTPKTLRVDYQISPIVWLSEWVCVEHTGFARDKAERWWSKRCDFPCPDEAIVAVAAAEHGLLARPLTVKVKTKPGEKFPEVMTGQVGPVPEGPDPCPECERLNFRVVSSEGSQYGIICGGCGHGFSMASYDHAERFGYIEDADDPPTGGMLPKEWGIGEWGQCERSSPREVAGDYDCYPDGETPADVVEQVDDCPF